MPLALKQEILEKGKLLSVPAGTEILREGQYVQVVPLVLEGLLKVFSSYEDKELLLYYIAPAESCVMSFSAALWHTPSKVFAIAEEDTQALLLPVDLLRDWVKKYPSLNDLFFQQFNKRYEDLLQTIHLVLFEKMDKRLYDYLKEKAKNLDTERIDLRHHQIAREMGTAREVVTRVLKKLEKDRLIIQHANGIEIL
ncbi:MAG TPA: Crp/Fnr family transcriptional regulator [Saprospiraceae bacterium]|nr:Crp/Fnr family transcriptional regulator [Saprospiraceae bacterium]